MTRGKNRLTFLVETYVGTKDVAIAAKDSLFSRFPHDELHIGLFHIIVLIDIAIEARSASCFAEDDFSQSAHFAHQVGAFVAIEDI